MDGLRILAFGALVTLSLNACGGGEPPTVPVEFPPIPPAAPVSKAEAFQFLNQATFGATETEAQRVIGLGFEAWIDEQMRQPVSLQLPHLRSLPRPQLLLELQPDRLDIWFRNAINGDDQLRQRVAFALSEILVVSQLSELGNLTYSLADYYDVLARSAFGNYRDLLEEVTLHPAMGVYLSVLGNERPDEQLNIRPDENYAREVMQLFSVGLVQLNQDGSIESDNRGIPIPTYDQSVIEGFAHVFTGWNFAGAPAWELAFPNDFNQAAPMQLYPALHDTGEKRLLNGEVISAGQTGAADLTAALDNIFNHPNVGPFMAIRLIQRLVTSNPSSAYIGRVAAVFNDNGDGVRGDLGATVRAILLDPEARPDLPMEIDGKLKEPLLRLTQLWRAYNATSASGRYSFEAVNYFFGQGPLQSPSVFNFFSPFYAPPGEIRDSGLLAPELGIASEFQNALVTNYFLFQALGITSEVPGLGPDDVYIDISREMALADDTAALIDLVAEKLLAGQVSQGLRDQIAGMLGVIPASERALRVGEVIYFISSSPEFAYQR